MVSNGCLILKQTSFLPDDDFYSISRNGQRDEGLLNGKLYCIMSNQQAMSQLLSLWQRYQDGETDVFKRGLQDFVMSLPI